jgi:hypothetical protein
MNLKEQSEAETPVSGDLWRRATKTERKSLVQAVLSMDPLCLSLLEIGDVRDDGQIILRFAQPVGANKRGELLLDLESKLKAKVDPGLTIWLEPLGDRSSLRRLRGIEVKS